MGYSRMVPSVEDGVSEEGRWLFELVGVCFGLRSAVRDRLGYGMRCGGYGEKWLEVKTNQLYCICLKGSTPSRRDDAR